MKGAVQENLENLIDEIVRRLHERQSMFEELDLTRRARIPGNDDDKTGVNFLPGIQLQEVASVVRDEDEAFLDDRRHEIEIERVLKAPEDDMGGMMPPRMGMRHKVGRKAFVDKKCLVHDERLPAVSQSMHASMPSNGREG